MSQYVPVGEGQPIQQGEILREFPLVIVGEQARLSDMEIAHEASDTDKRLANVLKCDTVVMTQQCDIDNGKVLNILLCVAMSFDDFARSIRKEPSKSLESEVQKERRPPFHWLPPSQVDFEPAQIERVVCFHDCQLMPKAVVDQFLETSRRVRLDDLHRAHLSQRFGQCYSRIALPPYPVAK